MLTELAPLTGPAWPTDRVHVASVATALGSGFTTRQRGIDLVPTTRKLATALGLAAIVAAGSACQPGSTPTPNVASPTTASSVTTPPASPGRDEALIAYRGMWAAFVAAAKTSNPDAPDIRSYTSDNALTLIINALYVNRDQGKVILGALALDPQVTAAEPESDPTTVTIVDCMNSETWLEYWATGGLVDDKPGGKHHTTATVAKMISLG